MANDISEPDLTPMLDVVFILLIFFIVTATFVKETGIDIPSRNQQTKSVSTEESIILEISSDDRYFVNGAHADKRSLLSHLARLHAQNPDNGLVIRPSNNARTKSLVNALDAGRLLKMNVAISES
jgi:biopolymer transport protein ExbD